MKIYWLQSETLFDSTVSEVVTEIGGKILARPSASTWKLALTASAAQAIEDRYHWSLYENDTPEHCAELSMRTHGERVGSESTIVSEITENDVPEQFRYGSLNVWNAEKIAAFKAYCKEHSIYYYARPREDFSKHEAHELARQAGCRYMLLEDMS
jgi:hypothetical protein